jgi:hypothetical protein
VASQTFHRGIRSLVIAEWQAENTYGAPYRILGARRASLRWEIETDTLRGDDRDLDVFSEPSAVTISWEQASVDLDVVALLMGATLVYNADYEDLMIGEADAPQYIAISGRIVGSGGANDLHFFVPKAKISSALEFTAQLDTYMLPATELRGVHEGPINSMLRWRKFTAPTQTDIPMRTATGGFA